MPSRRRNLATLACLLAGAAIGFMHFKGTEFRETHEHNLLRPSVEYGLGRCRDDALRPQIDHGLAQQRLEHVRSDAATTVFKNATIIDGNGKVMHENTVIIKEDIIFRVCHPGDMACGASEQGSVVHELGGRYLTPGFVDMHSHVGVREVPELLASEDVTELNYGAVTPWARAVDGLKPHDMGIALSRSGGITTSLVLTGAKNMISGEAALIKMKVADSVPELLFSLINNSTRKPQRYLKMACGENIKASLGNTRRGPSTRQGESFEVRRAFSQARDLKQKQDEWCSVAREYPSHLRDPYPSDLSLQTLVDVFRGDIRTNAHCYEPEDIYSLYDHADEFGFNITALHHALEAHHVLDLITSHGSMLATFSDEWGFKKEVYRASAYMLIQAATAGIPIALTSDHPAKNGQFLVYEGQIANHFGLDQELVMASLTGVPAEALGIDNRVGHVRRGYDADLIVWDRHPLQLGARPLAVILEGKPVVNASADLWHASLHHDKISRTGAPPHRSQQHEPKGCQVKSKDFAVFGLKYNFLISPPAGQDTARDQDLVLLVREGKVQCIGGNTCISRAQEALREGVPNIEVDQGYLLPGLTIVTRNHGLAEILSEDSTTDGMSTGEDFEAPTETSLGLSFGGLHLDRAHRSGITRIITPPRSSGLFHGISAAFRPGALHRFDDGAIVKDDVALHFTIGHESKSAKFPTISAQIAQLRFLLSEGNRSSPVFHRASKGDIPVVIHTGNKDVISLVVEIKLRQPHLRLVIMGGAEASHVASELAKADVPVILAPWMCHPWSWEVKDCLSGPPLTRDTPASALLKANVTVGLGNWDSRDRYVRNAIWEASWLAGPSDPRLAVDLVSRDVEQILGLPASDHFVVYQGNPFEFGSSVALVFEEGMIQSCWPDVE